MALVLAPLTLTWCEPQHMGDIHHLEDILIHWKATAIADRQDTKGLELSLCLVFSLALCCLLQGAVVLLQSVFETLVLGQRLWRHLLP